MFLLEGVRDVLEEDQAKDDVLVLGGVHAATQRVGGLPELLLEADVRAVGLRGFWSCLSGQWLPLSVCSVFSIGGKESQGRAA